MIPEIIGSLHEAYAGRIDGNTEARLRACVLIKAGKLALLQLDRSPASLSAFMHHSRSRKREHPTFSVIEA